MSTSKARAGIVGLGRHGLRHLSAYQKLDAQVEVVAVCDVDGDRAKEVAAAHQLQSYTDWQVMLEREALDTLSVVTNGPSHAALVIAAAQAGVKGVFCEKPMATSVADARAMLQACEAAGTRLAISHGRRWNPGYQKLQALIADGLIGRLCHIWFTCGSGLFAGNGSHFLDLMRMLSGANPVSVVGFVDQTGTPNPRGNQFRDPGAVGLYWFDNGMRATLDMYEDLGVPPRLEIVGEIGRILIDEVSQRWEIQARKGGDRQQPVQQYWLPLVDHSFDPGELDVIDMLVCALRDLLGAGGIACTGQDGLASLEMLIGVHASSQNGNLPIQLPLPECYYQLDIPFT